MKSFCVENYNETYYILVGTEPIKCWYHRDEIDPKTGLSLPAYVEKDGYKSWFIDNKRNRIDGPAVEFAGGRIKTQYWINENRIWQLDNKYIYGKNKLAAALLLI